MGVGRSTRGIYIRSGCFRCGLDKGNVTSVNKSRSITKIDVL